MNSGQKWSAEVCETALKRDQFKICELFTIFEYLKDKNLV